jgi:hypothetical protein
MISSFWFITARSFKNRILLRLRRLRQPRYAIGFVVGLIYFWFMVVRRVWSHHVTVGIAGAGIPASRGVIDFLSAAVLVLLILAWAWPEQSGGLTFSPAEIQFLFPAPMSRRALLLYKVFRQQPQILISSLMMTIFGFRQAHFIGVWIPFVGIAAYMTMVGLARARLKMLGIGFLARLAIVLAVFAGLGWTVYASFRASGFDATQIASARAFFRAVDSPMRAPVIRAILFIPSLLSTAAVPLSFAQQAACCAGILVFTAICIGIAGQLNVRFEEASIRTSEKRAARIARMRGQRAGRYVMFPRMPATFRLRPSAHPEIAIIWKNLIAAVRIAIAWIPFLAFVGLLLFIPNMMTRQEYLRGVGATIALCAAGLFPFIASQTFSQDLRLDLPDIELLKSFPISGERLVAAEIATPLLIISILEFLMLSIGAIMAYRSHASGTLAFFGTPEFVVVALLFTIPICAAQLVIRNAVVVLLPGWAVRSAEEQRGFTVIGQRLVLFAGNLIVLAIALIPAAILFIPAFLVSRAYFHGSAAVLAISIVPSVALLIFEVWMAIRFLGTQFDKLDVTTEVGVAMF